MSYLLAMITSALFSRVVDAIDIRRELDFVAKREENHTADKIYQMSGDCIHFDVII